MVERADWVGLVRSRNDDFDRLVLTVPNASAVGTWSGPFRGIASDGREYFVKSMATCPAGQQMSLAIERVVAEIGQLINAPVCTTSLIRIPALLARWEPRPGIAVGEGLAHASLALTRADEQGRPRLAARGQDDNRRRHVGVYGLFDWCCGADNQWLYDLNSDCTLYSHDHGLYLPPVGTGSITEADLQSELNTPYVLPDDPAGLSPAAVAEVSAALDAVTQSDLAAILNHVPASWPVNDELLETLGWFLEHRAPAVANRLRSLI